MKQQREVPRRGSVPTTQVRRGPGRPRKSEAARSDCAKDPKPFVKWVGGKRQIVAELLKHVPSHLAGHTYHEPFVGGGALFFAVRPERAVLSDNNERLIRTYCGVRDQVDDVIGLLRAYERKHGEEQFYRVRARPIDGQSDADVAAWLIYLNKTAYNGLYRVNSRNIFNVPFGRYVNPAICDEGNLRACAAALAGVTIRHEDFSFVAKRAKRGDFVYFDPPYVPLSATSYFTSYTAEGFGPSDQAKLRDVALQLKRKRVQVLLSNSGAGFVRELYAKGFELQEVAALRNVNCRAEGRGPVKELLIR
jgi:DNA adenine methylase